MCGRFNLLATPRQLAGQLGLARPPKVAPRYNIAPGQTILAVLARADGQPTAVRLSWGLPMPWARGGQRLINARAETVAHKPAFRDALAHRRCLVPASGFYEWQTTAAGKRPFHVRDRDRPLLAFAGIWEPWPQAATTVYGCAILTRPAAAALSALHPRMPAIIAPDDYPAWLAGELSPAQLAGPLYGGHYLGLAATAVSAWVNHPAHDDPACLAPAHNGH